MDCESWKLMQLSLNPAPTVCAWLRLKGDAAGQAACNLWHRLSHAGLAGSLNHDCMRQHSRQQAAQARQ